MAGQDVDAKAATLGRQAAAFVSCYRAAVILFLATLLAYLPTVVKLAAGPWNTEQDGHGPFIIAAAAWVTWRNFLHFRSRAFVPTPVFGWPVLIAGLFVLVLARSQDILVVEVLTLIPVMIGCTLIVGGWAGLRAFAFPIGLMVFAAPPPGWLLDYVTVPLKALVSDVVVRLIYAAGYPIAQNGVVIMIGSYQLLVKDACAGMNSIFALSAIGFLYIYIVGHASRVRNALLLLSILPITIAANFVRVVCLVLLAYYFGIGIIETYLHEMTGVVLFAFSFALIMLLDGLMNVLQRLLRAAVPRRARPT
ncbi:hypothetical protein ES708_03223 [subsurface metagenome]